MPGEPLVGREELRVTSAEHPRRYAVVGNAQDAITDAFLTAREL